MLVIDGILLAAGESRRFGDDDKLLTPWRGAPLVAQAAAVLAAAVASGRLRELVAVVSCAGNAVAAAIETATNGAARIVENPDYESGVASSLRVGVDALAADSDAALVLPADMPLVGGADVAAVIAAFRRAPASQFVAAAYGGKRGNPVLIARTQLANLRALRGDCGARALFAETPPLLAEAGAGVLFDVDAPADVTAAAAATAPASKR